MPRHLTRHLARHEVHTEHEGDATNGAVEKHEREETSQGYATRMWTRLTRTCVCIASIVFFRFTILADLALSFSLRSATSAFSCSISAASDLICGVPETMWWDERSLAMCPSQLMQRG